MQERAPVADLAEHSQEVKGSNLELAYAVHGYTGLKPAANAKQHGIWFDVEKLSATKNLLCSLLVRGG